MDVKKTMMNTLEIPRERWLSFLNAFSVEHDGWLVSTEVLDPNLGAQPTATDLPLVGIIADRAESGLPKTVTILLGESQERHVAHAVACPTHLRVEQTQEGADVALQIEAEDGTTTILRFRAVALPETVDGLAR